MARLAYPKLSLKIIYFFQFILLEEERFVEIHTNYGKYFRLRIPHFGRDMAFCREISEAYIVGNQ